MSSTAQANRNDDSIEATTTSSFSGCRSVSSSRPSFRPATSTAVPFSVTEVSSSGLTSSQVVGLEAVNLIVVVDPNVRSPWVRSRSTSYDWTESAAARVRASTRSRTDCVSSFHAGD